MLLIGLALAMDAETAWVEGDPVAAASAWADRIDAGEVDGDLYYNLGNALYAHGDLAGAIAKGAGSVDKVEVTVKRVPELMPEEVAKNAGVKLVVDSVSLDLVAGSTVDFVESLGGAAFRVENPQAAAGCGCGSSFGI